MQTDDTSDLILARSPADIDTEEFRATGHALVDAVAAHMERIRDLPVTPGDDPARVWKELGRRSLPDEGAPIGDLFEKAVTLLEQNSLFNGHPRFWGYITASPSPVGLLSDLLASAMNPNCGGWTLSPMASAIELQTVQWLAEFIGYPTPCGGMLVSGGNMANFLGFFAARRAYLGETAREDGIGDRKLTVYTSEATHTWLQKAADVAGLGTHSIRYVRTIDERMDCDALSTLIEADRKGGMEPFLVVATAGTVSTGAVDPLIDIAKVCRREQIWLHVDGAYGAPVAALPEAAEDYRAISQADSVALDPHKWFYAPLEAGCVLVKDPAALEAAFSFRPPYYYFHAEDERVNFYEHGLQNSRGFRALKVWMSLLHLGRQGHVDAIRRDIALTKAMRDSLAMHSQIEIRTCRLSIVTFRYLPQNGSDADELNQRILAQMQVEGRAFVSNAIIDGSFFLRACIVNFRTTVEDVQSLAPIVIDLGQRLDV